MHRQARMMLRAASVRRQLPTPLRKPRASFVVVLLSETRPRRFDVSNVWIRLHWSNPHWSTRSELKARAQRSGERLDLDAILAVVANQLPPAIEATRRYQTLQALVNCTRRSLLPDPAVTEQQRQGWDAELRRLEAQGHGR